MTCSINSSKVDSTKPTPTAEEWAVFTLAVVSKAAPTTAKGAANAYTNGQKTGRIYHSRKVKNGTNRDIMSCITPTPSAEKPAAFTLAVV